MSDLELAEALVVPLDLVPRIKPEKRAMYERLIALADALNRGERPDGVIVCEAR